MKFSNNTAEELLSIIEKKDREIAERDRRITELEQRMELIIAHLKLSKHNQYASSSEKSKVPDNQILMFNEAEASADLSLPEPEITEVKSHYRKKTRLTTDKLPDDLPVEIIEYEIPEQERICPDCNNPLHRMGKEEREELKVIPAKIVIVRHVRHIYSCRCCENNSDHVNIIKAQLPNPVIRKAMASPLYRQEQEWKQRGILISRQTMSNWLLKACDDRLAPLYDRMKEDLLKRNILHADETPVSVLKEPNKPAQSKKYMWLYRTSGNTDKHIVIYDYKPDRKHEYAKDFLKGFKGYLHVDGYEAYHGLPEEIVVVGCVGHLRRYFFDALKTLPKNMRSQSNAQIGVSYCDKLFSLEKQFAEYTAEKRYEMRLELSKPVFEALYKWLDTLQGISYNLLGKAKAYALNQKPYLEKYLTDGNLEISNNRALSLFKIYSEHPEKSVVYAAVA